MRLWSLHPSYLDSKGLVALWREALLAQAVLLGKTKGYQQHPQLWRFKATGNPVGAVASYLRYVADEADQRGYQFDRQRIARASIRRQLPLQRGQLDYEVQHLLRKLWQRDRQRHTELKKQHRVKVHPLFKVVKGSVEEWEKVKA